LSGRDVVDGLESRLVVVSSGTISPSLLLLPTYFHYMLIQIQKLREALLELKLLEVSANANLVVNRGHARHIDRGVLKTDLKPLFTALNELVDLLVLVLCKALSILGPVLDINDFVAYLLDLIEIDAPAFRII
jgi:hypothetical protein